MRYRAQHWKDVPGVKYPEPLPPEEQKKALPGPRMVALVECRIWNEISRWKDPYPPFDYNSGMDVLPVDAEEAAELGLVRDEEVPRSEEAEDFRREEGAAGE